MTMVGDHSTQIVNRRTTMNRDELIEHQREEIKALKATLVRAQEDMDWMLNNSGDLLNGYVFNYIDEVLKNDWTRK